MTTFAPRHSLADLARRIGGELRAGTGQAGLFVTGVNSLDEASPEEITFIADDAHARRWSDSRAFAAIVSRGISLADDPHPSRPLIIVPNPPGALLALNSLLPLFRPPLQGGPEPGIHSSAVVHPSVSLEAGTRIGPHVSIDRGCRLGRDVVVHAGARLHEDVHIGDRSVIHANCVIREHCRLGASVVLHQNASIGADGFGYAPAADGSHLVKIEHIGNVIIEDDVEIGAGTCVDRAKFGSTIVGRGTKIDNLCQVGHNCRIGRGCVIAALTGLAGSVVLEDGVRVGGCVGIADHIHVGRGAQIGAKSGVTRDVDAGETVLGMPAGPAMQTLRQWAVFHKLPRLLERLREGSERKP